MHADLHSRNWKVQENHRDSKIIIYDFGICFKSISADKNMIIWEALQEVNLEVIFNEREYLVKGDNNLLKLEDLNELEFLKEIKFDMNLVMKKLRTIFIKKNLQITKLFMNFIVWASLFDDIIRDSGCFIKEETGVNKEDIAKHQNATIIAYCETSNCYPLVYKYMKKKYEETNIKNIFEYDNELEFSDPEDL